MKYFLLFLLVLVTSCTKKIDADPNHKVLHFPISDDYRTLDPSGAYDVVSLMLLPLASESLFQYNIKERPLKLEPLLAANMPQVSKDKKTYTIKIKQGVKFADDPAFTDGKGRELVANDFIYAWKRLLVPELHSGGTWIFEDKVIGYSELRKEIESKSLPVDQLLQKDIPGFKAIDPYTIQISLLKPYPQLMDVLAMGFAAPVPVEAVQKYGMDGLSNRLIGTGPFLLKSAVRGSKVILVKNPNYRDEKFEGKTLPFVHEIQFEVLKEEQPAWLKFLKGQLDVSAIPKDSFSSVIADKKPTAELTSKGINLQTSVDPTLVYFAFNMKDKLLGSNANLRKALLSSINREEWINLFLNGRGIKATSIVPMGLSGHIDREKVAGDFDLEAAKSFLAKAGFPEGKGLPPIKFDLRGTSPTQKQQGEYVAMSAAKIGVKLEVTSNTFPAFLEKEKRGDLQFFIASWIADYPDAENFFQLLYSKNMAPGPNYANFSNPQFDKLFLEFSGIPPSDGRTKLIGQAEEIIFDAGVWGLVNYPIRYALSQAWVKNYFPHSIITNYPKYLDIDTNAKKTTIEQHY